MSDPFLSDGLRGSYLKRGRSREVGVKEKSLINGAR